MTLQSEIEVSTETPEWQVLLDTTIPFPDESPWVLRCAAYPPQEFDPSATVESVRADLLDTFGIEHVPGVDSLQTSDGSAVALSEGVLGHVVGMPTAVRYDVTTLYLGKAILDLLPVYYDNDPFGRAQRITTLHGVLNDFPTPVFGSPPQGFRKVAEVLTQGAHIGVTGTVLATGHPALAVLSASGSFVFWLLKPSARVVRRSLAERVAAAMGTGFREDDER